MAITPNPGPQDHTSQAVLCVDRCHSEMTLTDSLKHQTVPSNSPEGTGPWAKPPANHPSFCVPLTQQIPFQEEEESPEQGSQGQETLRFLGISLTLAQESLLETGESEQI